MAVPNIDELAAISAGISGVSPDFIKAQWQHETGNFSNWGATNANNYGGMKQFKEQPSWFAGDAKSPEGDNYQVFNSPQEYAEYFGNYLKKYVPGANTAKTPDEYAVALKNMGYYGAPVEEYSNALRGHIAAPHGGIAGAGANNSQAAIRNNTQINIASNSGGTDINAAFQQFLGEYNKPKQFDQSMLSQMEEAMKPTNHRKQAMDAFLESMIGMAKAGAKLDHPEALKEVMGSMQFMNQMNMGYAEQMEKEEQQQKRMKIGMSALQKYGQQGADKSAYGTLFQMATGQRMFEDPDRMSPKDLLNATVQVASANRANAYYDIATQNMRNNEIRTQIAMQKQAEAEKAGIQKQQPTLDDRVKFFKYLEEKAASYSEKDQRREQYLKSGGFQQDVRLAQQMGIDPSEVALLFGGTLKPRA